MSRNFELLQRAQRLREHKSLVASVESVAAPREPGSVDGLFEPLPDLEQRIPAALPAASLDAVRRLELTRLAGSIFHAGTASPRMVVVAAVDQTDACGWITACLGELLAGRSERSVCIVDADVRQGAMHNLLQIAPDPGWSDALREALPLRSCYRRLQDKLWVLTAGSEGLDQRIVMENLRSLLQSLHQDFTHSLVGCPPVGVFPHLPELTPFVDGVVLIVEAGATRREKVTAAKDALDRARIPVLGAILNNRSFPVPQWLYERL